MNDSEREEWSTGERRPGDVSYAPVADDEEVWIDEKGRMFLPRDKRRLYVHPSPTGFTMAFRVPEIGEVSPRLGAGPTGPERMLKQW